MLRWENPRQPCWLANLEYHRKKKPLKSANRTVKQEATTTSQCGTRAGYYAHLERGERSCQPCKDAPSEQIKIREERIILAKATIKTEKVRKEPTAAPICGTYSGYSRHGKRGESNCEPCKVAGKEYGRRWRKENFDVRKISKDAWRQKNKERIKKTKEEWYIKNYETERGKQRIYTESHRKELKLGAKNTGKKTAIASRNILMQELHVCLMPLQRATLLRTFYKPTGMIVIFVD